MAQRPHVRPRESPLTAPLNKQDWVRYLVEERAAKQQKTLLSPATEPARPCNGRFQVYTESVQSGLHAKMRMAENTIMPLLKENFCLEQRERANEVLKEEGIMFRFPLKAKGQRISISSRDVRLMGDGVLSPSVLSPLGALARVWSAYK